MNWIRASELQRDLFTPAVNATVMNGFEAQEVGGENSRGEEEGQPPRIPSRGLFNFGGSMFASGPACLWWWGGVPARSRGDLQVHSAARSSLCVVAVQVAAAAASAVVPVVLISALSAPMLY